MVCLFVCLLVSTTKTSDSELPVLAQFTSAHLSRSHTCRFTISAIVVCATKISRWIKVRRHRTASITFEKMKKESISWRKVVWRRHSMLIKKKSTLYTNQPGWNPAIALLKFIFLFATSGWINRKSWYFFFVTHVTQLATNHIYNYSWCLSKCHWLPLRSLHCLLKQ